MRRFVVIFMILMILLSTSVFALKPKEGSIIASVPTDGMTYVSAKPYSVAPSSFVTLENVNNGAVKNVIADKYGRFTVAIPAQTGDEIRVTYEGGDIVVDNFPDMGFGEAVWIGYSAGKAYAKAMTEPLVSDDGEINFEKILGPFASAFFVGKEVTE
ncbi:hypothetical protein KY335_00215 [Candidatus Woesearchaeota archaeon]|nr:hypothetical protein [Candidatus Woesearchaeota archaeon]MBW3013647.1 hypothetical protein [Candidatus Woesearchaeota archaeon]